RRPRRVEEVRARDELDELRDDGIRDRRPLRVAEDQAVEVEALALPKALVGEEEEGSVLAGVDGGAARAEARQVERAADVAAELVALEGRRVVQREVEEVARIERVVAQELEQLAVEFVRAGARGDVDDRAGVAAVLGAEGRVVGLELLHGVDRSEERRVGKEGRSRRGARSRNEQ